MQTSMAVPSSSSIEQHEQMRLCWVLAVECATLTPFGNISHRSTGMLSQMLLEAVVEVPTTSGTLQKGVSRPSYTRYRPGERSEVIHLIYVLHYHDLTARSFHIVCVRRYLTSRYLLHFHAPEPHRSLSLCEFFHAHVPAAQVVGSHNIFRLYMCC